MTTSKDALFELVKSLENEEKRMFKKQEKHKKSDAMRLFDILSSIESYNATVVKKKFKKDSHLAVTKNVLTKKILDYLRGNRGGKEIANQRIALTEEIIDLEILLQKMKQISPSTWSILRQANKLLSLSQ